MFTGIVEERGRIGRLEERDGSALLEVRCASVIADAGVGDSIAVDGCCVTVTALTPDGFAADLMGETLARTALAGARPGQAVNLERALRADGRLGGHIVQGHVDGVAHVRAIAPQPDQTTMAFDLPPPLAPLVAEKGSVAVAGVSLTVMAVDDAGFAVGLIPHTLASTTLGALDVGDRVNVEVDVLAKYVSRLLGPHGAPAS